MNIKRRLINCFDFSGGRTLLGKLATIKARASSHRDIEVFFDSVWLHRIDNQYFADSQDFRFYGNTVFDWLHEHEVRPQRVADYWYHLYKPKFGDIILDIGAGIGTDTPEMSRAVGLSGRVIAIEAHPITYSMLERSIYWNELSNVACHMYAMADKAGTVSITDTDSHESNAISSAEKDATFTVESLTIDQFCKTQGIDRLNFLKMNIEGAERLAIQGMNKTIENTEYVCIAAHDFRADKESNEWFRTRDLVMEFLKDYGFELLTRENDSREWVRDHVHGKNKKLSHVN